ncbi:hypothetical protein VKT23_002231 [Stygiomarasmius scandens]|uniref:Uncharacterized protein n=1 Tax=Marasmiellus scandens TaxID=2682957 RepID=A0ABR1K1T4_9AGAR
MPRVLPRLLPRLAANSSSKFDPFSLESVRWRGKSLRRPVPVHLSLHPADNSRSILLTRDNQITSSKKYVHHKSLPPRVHVGDRAGAKAGLYDKPRSMSEEERRWWSSPYLRMLGSPLRQCLLTGQYLPKDFLIRLGAFRVSPPTSRFIAVGRAPDAALMPDGLLHSKFQVRRSGKAGYVLCWKDAISLLREKGSYRRVVHNSHLHALLEQQIGHLLRLRVLQELQLVIDQLHFRPKHMADRTLVRRLTRLEWQKLNQEGILDIPNALAVIVVPPLNKNTITKKRPEPSMSDFPPTQDGEPMSETPRKRSDLPLSEMRAEAPPHSSLNSDEIEDLSSNQIPLYHGASMFPNVTQRAALHRLLCRILSLERKARYKKGIPVKADQDKDSHAFALMADEHNVKNADIAAVCIALWRVKMFEGIGWEDHCGWITRSKYYSVERYE